MLREVAGVPVHLVATRDGPDDHSRGRRALELLGLLGSHERTSVTHAGGLAVAAGAGDVDGVGVDYEPRRPHVNARMSRFFLSGPELASADLSADGIVRHWTAKEAVFKATPDNRDLVLADFEVCDGFAFGPCPPGTGLFVATWPWAAGFLSVAVCRRRP